MPAFIGTASLAGGQSSPWQLAEACGEDFLGWLGLPLAAKHAQSNFRGRRCLGHQQLEGPWVAYLFAVELGYPIAILQAGFLGCATRSHAPYQHAPAFISQVQLL